MKTMDTDNVVVAEEKEEEEEDPYPFDIYISARINDDLEYRWYVIENDTRENEFLSPVFSDLQPNCKFASSSACVVALGSFLYVVGGFDLTDKNHDEDGNLIIFNPLIEPPHTDDDLYTNEVYRIDTLHPDDGWTKCPPMAKKRTGALAFSLDGKIYVLGGFTLPVIFKRPDCWPDWFLRDDDDSSTSIDVPSSQSQSTSQHNNYIEVLDPEEGEAKWRPALSSIPDDYLREHHIDAYLIRGKPSGGGACELFVRIVGNETQKLFRYDFNDESWTLYAKNFGPYRCQSLVFADDILYSYDNYPAWEGKLTKASKVAPGSILCFDVNKPEAEPNELKGLEDLLPKPKYFNMFPIVTLHHLGGTKFCLIWEGDAIPREKEKKEGDAIVVTCLKFTVSKVPLEKQGEFDFCATKPSKSSYYLEAKDFVNIISIKRKEMVDRAIKLKENRNKFGDEVGYPTLLKDIWDTSSTSYEHFETRKLVFEEIMEALRDDRNSKIGICGMAGVGKTTMVEEVGKQVGKGPFDEVAMAVFSQNPELKKIQEKLADCLNLKLEKESEEGRAAELCNRLKNGRKILVILDDVWDDKITLKKIGIPVLDTDENSMGCKILLTSRRLEVCKKMGFEKTFLIGLLSIDEAWHLFKRTVGDFIEADPIHSVAQQVCTECDHLPLAICAVGGALSGLDDKHIWNDALEQLKQCHGYKIAGVEEKVYSCIEWSYRYLKHADVQSCFLHCSLFPEHTEIAFDLLVCFGVGTKFLGSIDRASMKKARERTLVIVGILKKSNLLLEGRDRNKVKMHDIVRDVAISIASKDNDWLLVQDGVDVWPDKDDYTYCKVISLRASCNVRELPDRLECPELCTLVLGSSDASLLELPNSFFERIKRLEVLVLNKMKLVPSSLSHLVGLRMLCLSDCELVNLSFIKELKNLEMLVIGNIYEFKEMVLEIGQLTCLRLLDLREFNKGIGFSSGLLSCLSKLEELYISKEYNGWEVEGNASIVEINCLTSLTALDIYIPNDVFLLLPKDLPSFKLLTKYKIWIGCRGYFSMLDKHTETKVLGLDGIPLMDGLDVLIANAEVLFLYDLEGSKKVLHDRDTEWFSDLKFLSVWECEDMEHLLGKPKWSSKTHGPSSLSSFGKLRVLQVRRCRSMKYLFSASTARCLPKLHKLEIEECEALEEIIGGDEKVTDKVYFRQLKKLTLYGLPNLRSIYANRKKTSTTECSMPSTVKQPLFNEKVMFPILEELYIKGLDSIEAIWDKQLLPVLKAGDSFQHLQELRAVYCRSMKYLFSSSTAKLHELEIEECEALEGDEKVTIIFHQLKKLELERLPNFRSIWQSSTTECSMPLFNEKVMFPVLEELYIRELDSIKAIWDKQLLSVLKARDSFQHLKELRVHSCKEMEEILAFEVGQGGEEAEANDEIPVFPHLKNIQLRNLSNLKSSEEETKESRLQTLVNHKVRFPSLKNLKIDAESVEESVKKSVKIDAESVEESVKKSVWKRVKSVWKGAWKSVTKGAWKRV